MYTGVVSFPGHSVGLPGVMSLAVTLFVGHPLCKKISH